MSVVEAEEMLARSRNSKCENVETLVIGFILFGQFM